MITNMTDDEHHRQGKGEELVGGHADAGAERDGDLDFAGEIRRLRGEDEFEQAAERHRRAEARHDHDDGVAACPEAAEEDEVETEREQPGQCHRDRPGDEQRPAEREWAERRHVPPDGEADHAGQRQRRVGAPGDELAVGEVGEAEDRVGQRHADRAKADHGADQEAIGDELEVHAIDLLLRRAAEIKLGDRRVVPEVGGAAGVAVLAFGQHVGAVADAERGADVLLDEQDGDAGLADRFQAEEHGLDHLRRQAGRSLVEYQQLRPHHQGAGNRQHLPFAARHASGEDVPPLGEAREKGIHLADPLAPAGAGQHRGGEGEVVVHGHAGEDVLRLRHEGEAVADHLVGGKGGDVGAFEPHGSGEFRHQPGDGPDQRRFAGAVRTEDRDDLALARPRCWRHGRSARPARSRRRVSRRGASAPRSRAAAEVGLDHAGVADHVGRRAFGEQPAAGHDEDMAAEARHQVHVVLDDQEGDAAAG